MRTRVVFIVWLMFFSLVTSGCASVLLPRNDKLRIVTDPPGATARTGDASITTPGVLSITRGQEPVSIRVEKEGYKPVVITVNWRRSALMWLNVIFIPAGGVAMVASSTSLSELTKFYEGLAGGGAVAAAAITVDLLNKKTYQLERDELVLRLEPNRSVEVQKETQP